jgi:hypothetical protein
MSCPICGIIVEDEFMNDHLDECLEEQTLQYEQEQEQLQYEQEQEQLHQYTEPVLTKSQEKALLYCGKKAKIHSKQTRGMVLTRFINMGYTEQDLNDVLSYIQFECDVTINCPTKVLVDHIIRSAHFKNGYEVSRDPGYLTSRTDWETNLFNGSYDENPVVERPKYGALNIFKYPTGSTTGYGKSHFVLRKEVRNRITFVNGDSSLKMFHICTFQDCVALLVHLSDVYIKDMMNIIKHGKKCNPTAYGYIECQIHGLLRLNTDFDTLYLCGAECTSEQVEQVKFFCNNNGIDFFVH